MNKKNEIRKLARRLLRQSYTAMLSEVDKALNSGAIDTENWDKDNTPMIMPKVIVTAILEREATQYAAKGTSYEKTIRKEVNNLKCFI